MPARPRSNQAVAAAPSTQAVAGASGTRMSAGSRFRRVLFGYDRHGVDRDVRALERRLADLDATIAGLRDELGATRSAAAEAQHDLTRAHAELRTWNDRAAYVDGEVARARIEAAKLEADARARAEVVESEAQERSLQLIDRVCQEANSLLTAAREEAREMFVRFETEVDVSQRKLDRLEQARREIATTMQSALHQFEEAVAEVNKVAPAKRLVEALEEPARRTPPTFGTHRALEAARRFAEGTDPSTTAALSTPLPAVFGATVIDMPTTLDVPTTDAAAAVVVTDGDDAEHAQGPRAHIHPAVHDADETAATDVLDDELAEEVFGNVVTGTLPNASAPLHVVR